MTWQILMFSFLLLSNYLWNFCQNEKCADIITCKTHCRKMNMSIKVCVPHHTSSQKHLLISICKALPPEPSLTPLRGLPVAFPHSCLLHASCVGRVPASLPLPLATRAAPWPQGTGPLLARAAARQAHRETGGSSAERRLSCPPLQPEASRGTRGTTACLLSALPRCCGRVPALPRLSQLGTCTARMPLLCGAAARGQLCSSPWPQSKCELLGAPVLCSGLAVHY